VAACLAVKGLVVVSHHASLTPPELEFRVARALGRGMHMGTV